MGGTSYNGYSGAERDAKFKVLLALIKAGEIPEAGGPCMLCDDPDVPVMYHDEDYSEPYIWEPPALLCLCRNCHMDKLHKRFARPASHWAAFLAHVRRGGYARDLQDPMVKREVDACRAALDRAEFFDLRRLRPYGGSIGAEWFANLRLDEASKTDPAARPRP